MNPTYPHPLYEHSIGEILDELEEAQPSYGVEEIGGYFLCSRDYWLGLDPAKKAELLEEHPHLDGVFE